MLVGLVAWTRAIGQEPRATELHETGGLRISVRSRAGADVSADVAPLRGRFGERFGQAMRFVPQGERMVIELPGYFDETAARMLVETDGDLTFRHIRELSDRAWTTRQATDSMGNELPYEEILDARSGKPVQAKVLDARVFGKPPLITGKELKPNARADIGTGKPVVHFEFVDGPRGKQKFEEISRGLVGKPLAIFLDKKLISAPTIEGVIPGEGIIQGRFTAEYAKRLADVLNLRIGRLPVPVEVVRVVTVRP
jgi:preprotein translocase subunit SecD